MAEGKIIKALSGFYYVLSEGKIVQCRGRGVFRAQKITPLVGDDVVFEATSPTDGYIMKVHERKNELVRPPIANVDQAVLVFSAVEPDFSAVLLDRFLVLIESKDIRPLIVVNKMDLLTEKTKPLVEAYIDDYRRIGYDVIQTSTVENSGVEQLLPYFANKTSVFAGQSGVGKSSILNAIRPDLQLKTNDISQHLGRGKHTTRHVELIEIGDGLVADTPGFSALEFNDIEEEQLPMCFPEFVKRSDECKFRGCMHIAEPKCAVKKALEAGEIPSYRYDHYVRFMEEIKERKTRY